MKSNTHTVSNPTSPASLPSTGSRFLDKELDHLDPVSKLVVLALLERHGRDHAVDLARERLSSQVEWLDDPDVVNRVCVAEDDSETEERIAFWQAYRAGWHSIQDQN
ncbi:MAG TPA: hypothetical protein VLI39_20650 [Sedimentisphaerales bacterium]|nr:hypothetical protein [Sedimentisphaerales bacterium]